jgi:hypothetical protein
MMTVIRLIECGIQPFCLPHQHFKRSQPQIVWIKQEQSYLLLLLWLTYSMIGIISPNEVKIHIYSLFTFCSSDYEFWDMCNKPG